MEAQLHAKRLNEKRNKGSVGECIQTGVNDIIC